MPKIVQEKKYEKKFHLTREDISKLQELLIYYHKNGSNTISTCIDVAYTKMKENKKETVLDEVLKSLGELNNELLKTRTEFNKQLAEQSSELNKRISKRAFHINEIVDFINTSKLIPGKIELSK